MSRPAMIVLDDHPDSLGILEETLRRRYGQDYLIVSETSVAAPLGRLAELQAIRRPVVLVMAAASIALAGDAEFLAQARGIQPAAKRVLVVPRGGPAAPSLRVPVPLVADRQAATPILRAMARGTVDAYLPAPGAGSDEGFHRAVSELLEEWAHDAAPALPAVRIIDHQRSARAHELRDTLARSSIPYTFHAAESADGHRGWRRPGRTARRSRSW